MYKYETHLHTYPVSACSSITVEQVLKLYSELGYDGIFITNHFLDGNINHEIRTKGYAEQINYYFDEYEKAKELAKQYKIKVFCGIETTGFDGTDFLVYGLDKAWFLAHEEWRELPKKKQLRLFREHGALVIQAHPFREDYYINHIRLFPREVDGIEVLNASRPDFENDMAKMYANHYGLKTIAGSDKHRIAVNPLKLAGVMSETPINSVEDFILAFREDRLKIFNDVIEK